MDSPLFIYTDMEILIRVVRNNAKEIYIFEESFRDDVAIYPVQGSVAVVDWSSDELLICKKKMIFPFKDYHVMDMKELVEAKVPRDLYSRYEKLELV